MVGSLEARSYNVGDDLVVNYMIPLHLIFNEISQIEDSGAVILCDGNTL